MKEANTLIVAMITLSLHFQTVKKTYNVLNVVAFIKGFFIMLNHQELVAQLDKVSKDLCIKFAKQKDIARQVFDSIKKDLSLCKMLQEKKWSILIPVWDGPLGFSKNIASVSLPYSVLAVDGSQIYYDKHQGPACYLINIGTVLLCY